MKKCDYLKMLNDLEKEIKEEKEAVYEEYGDYTDDAALAWSQRYEEYEKLIDELFEDAEAAGFPVHFDSDAGEWVEGVYVPSEN